MSWVEGRPSEFGIYTLDTLAIDEAFVNFSSTLPDVWLYELSAECLKCPFQYVMQLTNVSEENIRRISTAFPMTYRFRRSGDDAYVSADNYDPDQICELSYDFGEFGIYDVQARDDSCDLNVVLKPVNIYLPLLVVFFLFLALEALIWACNHSHILLPTLFCGKLFTGLKPRVQFEEPQCGRIRSLDVFRGLCIVMMIFVHDGGASYRWMQHVTWDGLQVADVIFPWFLWIMGMCIPMSVRGMVKKGLSRREILWRTSIRAGKLFLLGLFLGTIGGDPQDLRRYRIFGVLQRFGVSYFLCTTLAVWCLQERFEIQEQDENYYHRNSEIEFGRLYRYYLVFRDLLYLWKGWVIVTLAVTLHTLLILLVPVPGCSSGYLGPGGLYDNFAESSECMGGLTSYVDRKVWSESHLFAWCRANEIYNHGAGPSFDPEGTLGYLTTLLTVWQGVQMGFTLITHYDEEPGPFLLRLGIWSILQGVGAGVLCGWKQTGGWIPLNKNLWSLSFVLATNALAIALFALIFVTVDIFRLWTGSPLMEAGMNSIFLYVVHLVVNKMSPWHWTYGKMQTHFLQLLEAMWGISLWVLLAVWLRRKSIHYKL